MGKHNIWWNQLTVNKISNKGLIYWVHSPLEALALKLPSSHPAPSYVFCSFLPMLFSRVQSPWWFHFIRLVFSCTTATDGSQRCCRAAFAGTPTNWDEDLAFQLREGKGMLVLWIPAGESSHFVSTVWGILKREPRTSDGSGKSWLEPKLTCVQVSDLSLGTK